MGFPDGASGTDPPCQCGRHKRCKFNPWVGKIPWRRAWQPTPVCLPGESHGQRSLASCSPWGRKESDTTEVTWHSCTGSIVHDVAPVIKKKPHLPLQEMQETPVRSLGREDPLEKELATCSSVVAFLENPTDRGAWQTVVQGSPRVSHTHVHTLRKSHRIRAGK